MRKTKETMAEHILFTLRELLMIFVAISMMNGLLFGWAIALYIHEYNIASRLLTVLAGIAYIIYSVVLIRGIIKSTWDLA